MLYNYIDVLLRRNRMNRLQQFVRCKELGKPTDDDSLDEDQLREMEELAAIRGESTFREKIGPDGQPLRRDYGNLMNNYWIRVVTMAFTDTEKIISSLKLNEKKRHKRLGKKLDLIHNDQQKEVILELNIACKRFRLLIEKIAPG